MENRKNNLRRKFDLRHHTNRFYKSICTCRVAIPDRTGLYCERCGGHLVLRKLLAGDSEREGKRARKKGWSEFIIFVAALTGWILVAVPLVAIADEHYGALGRFLGLLGMIAGLAFIFKLFLRSEPEDEPDFEFEPEPEPQPEPEPESEGKLEERREIIKEWAQEDPLLDYKRWNDAYRKQVDHILERDDILDSEWVCLRGRFGEMRCVTKGMLKSLRKLEHNLKQEAKEFTDQFTEAFNSVAPKEDLSSRMLSAYEAAKAKAKKENDGEPETPPSTKPVKRRRRRQQKDEKDHPV